jgi:peptidoglycan/xylan/chitin deacetylase (PgdA/CDA1 family)
MALNPSDPAHNYSLSILQTEIGEILDRGWELGLHGGYYAYNDPKRMAIQRDRLEKLTGKKISGYRNHFLRFEVPTTWELLQTCGFKYDVTFGYSDTIGFRNGMCHPFQPYNRQSEATIKIIEIPLILMDVSLIRMQIQPSHAWEYVRKLLDSVRRNQGGVSILWHNNRMDGVWLRLYSKILQYGQQKNAWMTTGDEISQWWSQVTT